MFVAFPTTSHRSTSSPNEYDVESGFSHLQSGIKFEKNDETRYKKMKKKRNFKLLVLFSNEILLHQTVTRLSLQ